MDRGDFTTVNGRQRPPNLAVFYQQLLCEQLLKNREPAGLYLRPTVEYQSHLELGRGEKRVKGERPLLVGRGS